MSGYGSTTVTILIMICVIVVTGTLLSYLIQYVQNTIRQDVDFVEIFYQLANIDPWWDSCSMICKYPYTLSLSHIPSTHIEQIVQWRSQFLSIIISTPTIYEQFKLYYNLIASDYRLLAIIFCNAFIARWINIIENGAIFIGMLGFLHFVWMEVTNLRRLGGDEGFRRIILFGASLASLGNQALSRIAVVIGCAISCREVYDVTLAYGRIIGQRMGERILEPSVSE